MRIGPGALSAPSRVILLHNATICACDAILQAVGLRVTPGDRSHILRLEAALGQLDDDAEELLERLDASRARRNGTPKSQSAWRLKIESELALEQLHRANVALRAALPH